MLELLEGAENGRYKVVAKAEPYKNLPVSDNIFSTWLHVTIINIVIMIKCNHIVIIVCSRRQ